MQTQPSKEIEIYADRDHSVGLRIDRKNSTLWASVAQIADLFEVKVSTITKHLANIYKQRELKKGDTKKVYVIIQNENGRRVKRKINHYNLDAVISVGYRVNTSKATRFRIWTTGILKKYMLEGVVRNPLHPNDMNAYKQLQNSSALAQTEEVLELIKEFDRTWRGLEAYDKGQPIFSDDDLTQDDIKIQIEELRKEISALKQDRIKNGEASELFALESAPGAFDGIIQNIFQSALNKPVYPSIQEKAAHLLYFIIKDHPFHDGNKRVAAFTFMWFLRKAKIQFKCQITPISLAFMTVFIAESDIQYKSRMIDFVITLLAEEKPRNMTTRSAVQD